MKTNEILSEIHRVRCEHARRFGGNMKAIFDDMRLKQQRLDNVVERVVRESRRSAVAEDRAAYGEKK